MMNRKGGGTNVRRNIYKYYPSMQTCRKPVFSLRFELNVQIFFKELIHPKFTSPC